MKLLYYPHPSLQTVCNPYVHGSLSEQELNNIFNDMSTIMIESRGVGLSANQVGLFHRFIIIKDNKGNVHFFINPRVVDSEGNIRMEEGCLSYPGVSAPIVRPQSVLLEFEDIHNETRRIVAEGLEARAILHEIDHLDGVNYLERTTRQIRRAILSKLRKNK